MTYTKNEWASYMRDYRRNNPAYKTQTLSPMWKWGAWKTRLRLKYGVTSEWVGEKFLEQQGKCAICRENIYYNVWGTRADKTFSIHIDHNHRTKEPRGLLCQNCNIAIGKLQDSPVVLKLAYDYVSKYDEQ